MDFKLDDEAMQTLVVKAIMDGMTKERRDELIAGSIKALLEKPKNNDRNYYGDKTSALQTAFNRAVEQVALEHARKVVEEDPVFQEKIKGVFADVAEHLFRAESREGLVSAIGTTIRNALTKDRY